ncbi:MAG: MarR family transcriptional regulator [Chloroflexi bacterium]|nr:MarR family transcriptional regulator [Chloroflexota bacterium]
MKQALELSRNERMWVRLFATATVVQRARELELAKVGITPIQAGVLMILKTATRPVTPTQLARTLYREPHSMSALLQRMEKQGLIERTKDLEQRNLVRISITRKGEQTFKRQWAAKVTTSITSCLSDEEMEVLGTSLEKLRARAVEIIREMQPTPYD